MTRRRLRLALAAAAAMGVGIPLGIALGLGGTALLAPKDFPRFDPGHADRVATFFALGRSGAGVAAAPAAATPALLAARETLLATHAEFLRRERFASAVLDRYRPTVTRTGRRATPQVVQLIDRTRQGHARAREALAALSMPAPLAEARAATLKMLELAETAHAATLDAGQQRQPEFALVREQYYDRILAAHYAALAALRSVPRRQVSASAGGAVRPAAARRR